MGNGICRWGFVSTATISHKNWLAIKNSGNAVVAGVASRSLQAAQEFIDQCQRRCPFETTPTAFGNYDALIQSPDIDAIYVPLPTGLRKQWVIKAANAGKHVMCEKPCAASAEDLQEMISACERNNVQFMDGVMFVHSNRMPSIRQALDDGQIGEIKRINCNFSFCADQQWLASDIRINSQLEPQGCLGDLGWYCIRFVLWTMNWQMPSRVTATILSERHRQDSPGPVPIEFSTELFFADGVSASIYNSFITHHQQWANVSGSKGYVHINDFVLPYQGDQTTFEISNADFVMDGCDFYMANRRQSISTPEHGNSTPDSQEANLFRNFSQLALSGTPDRQWAEMSLKTQQVMDAALNAARNAKRTSELVS